MLAMDADSLGDLLRGEERLPEDVRILLRPIAEEGIAEAKAAIALRPDEARAHLAYGRCVGMLGVAMGKLEAVTSGIPGRVIRAYSRAIAIDDSCDGAGPLQLEGRFRTIVPAPYRNLRRARLSLHRAATLARVKQTLFFFGDAHARAGKLEAAEEAWRAALGAPSHPPAEPLARLIDMLIDRRLEMIER